MRLLSNCSRKQIDRCKIDNTQIRRNANSQMIQNWRLPAPRFMSITGSSLVTNQSNRQTRRACDAYERQRIVGRF